MACAPQDEVWAAVYAQHIRRTEPERMGDEVPVWYREPTEPDPTYAGRLEGATAWLGRSTVHRAVECRRFLNEHLSTFTLPDQQQFVMALQHRWDSAFFELTVGRVLQLLGAAVAVEQPAACGHRPDYHAVFPDRSITVEAASPVVSSDIHLFSKNQAPLLEYVESCIPTGWSVGVVQLPDLGPMDSKRSFKREVRRLLELPPPADDAIHRVYSDTLDGAIELTLISRAVVASDRLLTDSGRGFVDDTESRIRHTFKRKRPQVRSSREPVILAIHAGGLCSTVGSFDRALIGTTYSRYGRRSLEIEETGFERTGLLMKGSGDQPTFAAVLAFLRVGFNVCDQPVLYVHPRFRGNLPDGLLKLERRYFNSASQAVEFAPAVSSELLEGLNLVDSEA